MTKRSEEWLAGYDVGYEEGGSSTFADFDVWMHDVLNLADDWEMSECKQYVEEILGAWRTGAEHKTSAVPGAYFPDGCIVHAYMRLGEP